MDQRPGAGRCAMRDVAHFSDKRAGSFRNRVELNVQAGELTVHLGKSYQPVVIENPWTQLRELTAARIALGRAGHSVPTRELLAFQLAHARARDAVYEKLDWQGGALPHILLKSAARDRNTYLRRPDLGRRLAPESAETLRYGNWDAAIIVADGLSAAAVHHHAVPLLKALLAELDGWRIAPICAVEQGRVAIGDEIGERMGAKLAVVLIGERPGLSSMPLSFREQGRR